MGWLNWARFTCELDCARRPDECVSERLFRQQAEQLVSAGFRDAGYQYVNIDDCWSELQRDSSSGRLQANGSRFPAGLGALASFMHVRDLKLGLYGDCGLKTCAGYPAQLASHDFRSSGEQNHFELDANSLAEWRVDSFKLDGCHVDPEAAERVCPQFSWSLLRAQQQSGRPVLLTCEWPLYMVYAQAQPDWPLASRACNMWRYYDDVEGKSAGPKV